MSNLFIRFERLRWIFIDECSTIGCETLATGEYNAQNHIRDSNTWAMRNASYKRPWGGLNVGFTGDFWQFRPINQTALYDDPFRIYKSSNTERMLSMFWTHGPDGLEKLIELTVEHRCKDAWLSLFLKRARHGDMQHELYCYMHGLPTKHTGSWMPTTDDVLCEQASCRALPNTWEDEVIGDTARTWQERCRAECEVCRSHRLKRCRVLLGNLETQVLDVKFVDAPLIHPWNMPKYHASLVRARHYARRTQQILLWVVCEDTPVNIELRMLSEEEKDLKRKEWSMFHDQKTGGIMGLLPCVMNMPLRITQTDPNNKTVVFKNRRCRLAGWKLHAEDLERLGKCSTPEMKLEHLPLELYVRIPGATWVWSKELGAGVIAMKPTTVTWHLGKRDQVTVQRRGFAIASDSRLGLFFFWGGVDAGTWGGPPPPPPPKQNKKKAYFFFVLEPS